MNKTNIIDFLLREFNISDNNIKEVQVARVKKKQNKKNKLENISSLLDEVLVCFPKKEQAILKDKDEISANQWFDIHKAAKEAIHNHSKNNIEKNKLKKTEKFLNTISINSFLNSKKIIFSTAVISSLIFSIMLIHYQPKRTEKYVNFIDNNFFAFLQKSEKNLNNKEINNFAIKEHSDLSVAAAKAVYIVKNGSNFHNGKIINVSENDLFNEITNKLNKNFNNKEIIKEENKIFVYFKKIINMAKQQGYTSHLLGRFQLLNLINK